MKKLVLSIAPVVLVAACAMDQPSTSTEPAANDKVYTTGSNIPRRDKGSVQTMTPEEVEQMRSAAQGNMGRGRGN